jgi:hypothetical protein
MDLAARRALFRVLFDFVRRCEVQLHAWTFDKRNLTDADRLISSMSRELGALIKDGRAFFQQWERIVIYYDNDQKEITNVVNSVSNAHLNNVEVRRVAPADYSLFQVADLCCTLELLRAKIGSVGLSKSERDFFSTANASAERALKKVYLKPIDKKRFSPS